MLPIGLIFAALLGLASAAPPATNFVIHEQRTVLPNGFTGAGAAPADSVLNLRVGLVQGSPAGLENELYAVSTPSSSRYGQHLSTEEAISYLAPKPETVSAVNEWLSANGIEATPASVFGDWLSFSVTVDKANEMFKTNFTVFKHADTGKEAVRTLAYSIPADLVGHLDFVHPTISFPNPYAGQVHKHSAITPPPVTALNLSSNAVPSSCSTSITPACLQAIYGIPTAPATQSSNKLLVLGYIDQWAQSADLKSFLTKYRTDISSSTTWTLAEIDGGTNPQSKSDAGVEANLDTQYTIGIATGVPVTFLSVGESNSDGVDGFLDANNWVLAQNPVPHTMTTSYEFNESDLSSSVASNLCNSYMAVGAAGTSIFFSSGDGGVSGTQSQSCTKFVPTFPSSCPYVTAVGATTGITETAATFSSGGFSNYFTTPSYQTTQVKSYLTALGSTNSGKFSTTGRGFPDISAQGENFEIYSGGTLEGVDGTSCSSPTVAAIFSLLNDALISESKPPLGFVNPWLYSTATSALTDITTGDNPGCNTNGFPAKAGWDPVTGLGTPNYPKLKTAAGAS